MSDTFTLPALNLDYYNYNVIADFVFEIQKPAISGYEYEENGVYYCTTATENLQQRYHETESACGWQLAVSGMRYAVCGERCAVCGNKDACGRQCRQAVRTRLCGGIPADLTFLLLFWSSKKVEEMYVQLPEFTQSFNRYSYCLNNPLMYTDPTGQMFRNDIWEFDVKGNFKNRIPETKFDQIRIVDDNKQVIAQTGIFEYGTIQSHKRPTDIVAGKETLLDIFRINGDENAQQIFEFFAENTYGYNSKGDWVHLEWDRSQIGREGSEKNMVGTSHSVDFVSVGNYLLKKNYYIREHTHSHEYSPVPSGEIIHDVRTKDLRAAEVFQEKFPKINLNIYTCKYGYSPYNKNGTLDPQFRYLPPVIVKP